jgi:hypothetical protein
MMRRSLWEWIEDEGPWVLIILGLLLVLFG